MANLPPKPDLQSGEPRPPGAPLDPNNSKPGRRRESAISKAPQPPAGEGRLLEWFYPDRSTRFIAGLFGSLVVLAVYVIRDWGFSWIGNIWLWLIALPWPFVFLLAGRNERMSAGADWLAYGKDVFVKTYELTSVKVFIDGPAPAIEMLDRHGAGLRVKTFVLQQNHELWDLVYNGILHSVHVGGAETNKRARDYLLLEFPPHLRA
ncbi:hypothetical protein BA062_01270 [Prauserella flavalba]|uniref:Uncharacterized protein n=1 Tax=Prauserella flavalba TaxID=1477506 RepID=A0A318LVN9_9PSEU|nr:hypothetical protein BA062_01270 [Prauserella flavalba]